MSKSNCNGYCTGVGGGRVPPCHHCCEGPQAWTFLNERWCHCFFFLEKQERFVVEVGVCSELFFEQETSQTVDLMTPESACYETDNVINVVYDI